MFEILRNDEAQMLALFPPLPGLRSEAASLPPSCERDLSEPGSGGNVLIPLAGPLLPPPLHHGHHLPLPSLPGRQPPAGRGSGPAPELPPAGPPGEASPQPGSRHLLCLGPHQPLLHHGLLLAQSPRPRQPRQAQRGSLEVLASQPPAKPHQTVQ